MHAYIHVAQRAPDTTREENFTVVCLWSMLGLALTGLVWTLGFGIEVGQALIVAG